MEDDWDWVIDGGLWLAGILLVVVLLCGGLRCEVSVRSTPSEAGQP